MRTGYAKSRGAGPVRTHAAAGTGIERIMCKACSARSVQESRLIAAVRQSAMLHVAHLGRIRSGEISVQRDAGETTIVRAWHALALVGITGAALACGCSGRAVPPATDAGACDPARVRPAGWGRDWGCSSDADCTDGMNGRCYPCETVDLCSYDECFTDDDCAGDTQCVCGAGIVLGANRCLGRTEGCGGGASAVTYSDWSGISVAGLACLTTRDTCRSNAECGPGEYCTRGPLDGERLPFFRCFAPMGTTCTY